jgi:hypothetical protein
MKLLSECILILNKASKEFCQELANDIQENLDDTLYNARCDLMRGDFYIHEGDLWFDHDLMTDKRIIIKGDLIENGFCYDDTDCVLMKWVN